MVAPDLDGHGCFPEGRNLLYFLRVIKAYCYECENFVNRLSHYLDLVHILLHQQASRQLLGGV